MTNTREGIMLVSMRTTETTPNFVASSENFRIVSTDEWVAERKTLPT
jgi:hypothetical protein